MDIYHIWCDLAEGVHDTDFADAVERFLSNLKRNSKATHYRITRRKLGLGPNDIPEFHIWIEFRGLAQLDEAFTDVAARSEPIESFHHAVNQRVKNVRFALYRDFPDSHRARGEEKFG